MKTTGKAAPTIDMSKALQQAQSLLGMFASDLVQRMGEVDKASAQYLHSKDEAQRCLDTVEALREVERLL